MSTLKRILWLTWLVLGFFVLVCPPALAQTLTLQIPLSRTSHTFSLWELNVNQGAPGEVMSQAILELGIPAGIYQRNAIPGMNLIGGSFNEGIWIPGSNPFLQASVIRTPNTSTFFISDDTTGEVVHADTFALVNASWIPADGSEPMVYFSLPVARQDHAFLLNAFGTDPETMQPWSGWWQLSTMPPLTWFDIDDETFSYGFFEGWSFVPRGLQNANVYDINAHQFRSVTQSSSDLSDPNATWSPVATGFWPTVVAFVATGYSTDTYQVVSPYGSTQWIESVFNSELGVQGVFCVVGYNREFWIQRPSDGVTSSTYTVPWGSSSPTFDANGTFASGPTQSIQNLMFRASPPRNSSLEIKRLASGERFPIGWAEQSGMNVSDPSGQNTVWVPWYNGYNTINVAGGWTIVDENGNDLGQGPDFIDWPVFPNPTGIIYLPSTWRGRTLTVAGLESSLTPLNQSLNALLDDVFKPVSYWVTLDEYQLPLPWDQPNNAQLQDGETGEYSPTIGGGWFSLETWQPKSNLLLKISATRWSHNLQVRCANGSIFPVNRLQTQGDWSFDPGTGQSWFNDYGYFDASTSRRTGIAWYLYDVTTGEYLNADAGGDGKSFINATDDTDTDGDGLPDWYEHLIGTDPNDADTDNDGVNDGAEITNGTNPRVASAASNPNATLKVFTPLE